MIWFKKITALQFVCKYGLWGNRAKNSGVSNGPLSAEWHSDLPQRVFCFADAVNNHNIALRINAVINSANKIFYFFSSKLVIY